MLEKMQVSTPKRSAAQPQMWMPQACGSQYQEVPWREKTLSPNNLSHFAIEFLGRLLPWDIEGQPSYTINTWDVGKAQKRC